MQRVNRCRVGVPVAGWCLFASLTALSTAGDGCGDFVTDTRVHTLAHAVSAGASVAANDLDGDGLLDLVVADGAVIVLLNNCDGTFRRTSCAGTIEAASVTLGDLDGDGDSDALVGVGSGSTAGDVFILMNNGQGDLAPPLWMVQVGDVGEFELGDVLQLSIRRMLSCRWILLSVAIGRVRLARGDVPGPRDDL